MTSRWQENRWRPNRWRLGGAGLVVAGAVALVTAQLVSAGPALASSAPAGPGSAFAEANVLSAGPAYGGLSITVSAGTSTAYLQNSDARATAEAVDTSSLSTLLSSLPTIDALEPATADSAAGKSTKSNGGPVVGTETVSVNPSPESASATTQLVALDLPGVLDVTGQAVASVNYGAGTDQAASSDTDLTVQLAGGLVTLDGIRWSANQFVGSKEGASGDFTIGSIELSGTPLPVATPAELSSTIATVNGLLSSLGISIIMPATTSASATGVTISGLDLKVVRSLLTNTLFDPLLAPVGNLEKEVNAALDAGGSSLSSIASTVGTGETLGALVLGILAGAGQINLVLGGVSAASQSPSVFVNPLGSRPLENSASASVVPATSRSGSTGSGVPGSGVQPDDVTPTGASTPPVTVAGSSGATSQPRATSVQTVASGGGTPVRCTTTSASGHPSCWNGLASVAGAVLLIAGVGLFGGDIYISRRRRFQVVKEVKP